MKTVIFIQALSRPQTREAERLAKGISVSIGLIHPGGKVSALRFWGGWSFGTRQPQAAPEDQAPSANQSGKTRG